MQIRTFFTLGIAAAAFTVACGDSKSSLVPTAPSAAPVQSANVDAGVADGEYGTTANGPKPGKGNGNGNNGGGNGNGNGNGHGPRTPTNTSPEPTRPVPPGKSKVEFEGTVESVGSSSLLVNGQLIMVTSETVIRHGNVTFELSAVNPGDRVHVRANRVTAPTVTSGAVADATLEAAVILLQNPGQGDDTGEVDALVSVIASDATASETGANPGVFRLRRTGTATQLESPLTVTFTLTGTATNGTDYTAPLTATFPANQTTVDVEIAPTADGVAESDESVILTLTGVAPYELGSPIAATVTITGTVQQ